MSRASAVQTTRRLNHAREVLQQIDHLPDAVERMRRDCRISPRQAYRYLQHARRLKAPLAVGDAKVAFTVKLSRGLVRGVRLYAHATGSSLSDLVSRALTALIARSRRRG
jgi:hypothetical protein